MHGGLKIIWNHWKQIQEEQDSNLNFCMHNLLILYCQETVQHKDYRGTTDLGQDYWTASEVHHGV